MCVCVCVRLPAAVGGRVLQESQGNTPLLSGKNRKIKAIFLCMLDHLFVSSNKIHLHIPYATLKAIGDGSCNHYGFIVCVLVGICP